MKDAARVGALKSNYFAGRYSETIWLIGEGRSGTTWVADLINRNRQYRDMFEPFHPKRVSSFGFLGLNEYVRPDQDYPRLYCAAKDVFTGRFTHRRVDAANHRLVYRGIVVKDIFATLFAKLAQQNFPWVKITLLVRNPFSVALSKYNKGSWDWMTRPADFLCQKNFVDDYLSDFYDDIMGSESNHHGI